MFTLIGEELGLMDDNVTHQDGFCCLMYGYNM